MANCCGSEAPGQFEAAFAVKGDFEGTKLDSVKWKLAYKLAGVASDGGKNVWLGLVEKE